MADAEESGIHRINQHHPQKPPHSPRGPITIDMGNKTGIRAMYQMMLTMIAIILFITIFTSYKLMPSHVVVATPPRDLKVSSHEAYEISQFQQFAHMAVSMYPLSGPIQGGNVVTFMYSWQNGSLTKWGDYKFITGCKFGSKVATIEKLAQADSPGMIFASCIVPSHEQGTPTTNIDAALIVNGTLRYPNYGMDTYEYVSSHESSRKQPTKEDLGVCVTFKNQARFIREWIVFHEIFGVTRFYLYDQGSRDNYTEQIADMIDAGLVKIVPWDYDVRPSLRLQSAGLWHCLQRYGEEVEWMAFLDMDEFMFTMPQRTGEDRPNLVEFLKPYEKYNALMVDRLNFGPYGENGVRRVKRPEGLVMENYRMRVDLRRSQQAVKSIVRPSSVKWLGCGGVHTYLVVDPFPPQDAKSDLYPGVDETGNRREDWCGIPGDRMDTTVAKIRINHYFTKSEEDWNQRYVDWDGNIYGIKKGELFDKWKWFTEQDDELVPYFELVKKRMDHKYV